MRIFPIWVPGPWQMLLLIFSLKFFKLLHKTTLQVQSYFIVPRSQPIQKDRTHFWTSWTPWEGPLSHWLRSSIPRRFSRSRNLGSPKGMVRCKSLCMWGKIWFPVLERSFLTSMFSFLRFLVYPPPHCGRFYPLSYPCLIMERIIFYFFH